MDEEEFDSLAHWQPFGREDAMQTLHRRVRLANALWGRTASDLQRQLLARYPEIPASFDLADFRDLQQSASAISASRGGPKFAPKFAWMSPFASLGIFVGAQCFTAWEARCEIVRRAIEYLEKSP
jgi:hypothetical protein